MNYSTIFDRAAFRCQTPDGQRAGIMADFPLGEWGQLQRMKRQVGERTLKILAWIVSLLCLAPIVAVGFARTTSPSEVAIAVGQYQRLTLM